jgi:hypothetical protein
MTFLKTRLLIGYLFVAVALSACAALSSRLRQHTYPPDFHYITREQLSSMMWQLARDVRELEKTLREPGDVDEQRRETIIRLLISMDEKAAQLNSSGRRSNHPMLDANLPTFRRDILLARQGVERNNYTLVGLLPGGCVYCHGAAH